MMKMKGKKKIKKPIKKKATNHGYVFLATLAKAICKIGNTFWHMRRLYQKETIGG